MADLQAGTVVRRVLSQSSEFRERACAGDYDSGILLDAWGVALTHQIQDRFGDGGPDDFNAREIRRLIGTFRQCGQVAQEEGLRLSKKAFDSFIPILEEKAYRLDLASLDLREGAYLVGRIQYSIFGAHARVTPTGLKFEDLCIGEVNKTCSEPSRLLRINVREDAFLSNIPAHWRSNLFTIDFPYSRRFQEGQQGADAVVDSILNSGQSIICGLKSLGFSQLCYVQKGDIKFQENQR